jgi:hypothetical protein
MICLNTKVEVRVLDEPWNWDYFVKQQKARNYYGLTSQIYTIQF